MTLFSFLYQRVNLFVEIKPCAKATDSIHGKEKGTIALARIALLHTPVYLLHSTSASYLCGWLAASFRHWNMQSFPLNDSATLFFSLSHFLQSKILLLRDCKYVFSRKVDPFAAKCTSGRSDASSTVLALNIRAATVFPLTVNDSPTNCWIWARLCLSAGL